MLAEQMHCSLLLELPDKDLERCFWEDADTVRTYTFWDGYISTNMIISNVIMTRTLFRALANTAAFRYTWHMHANIALSLGTCAANLWLIFRHRDVYTRNRHTIIVCQRLLRVLCMCVAVYQSSAGLQAAIARALNVKQSLDAAATAGPLLRAAVLNLTRPLFVAPVITMAHASWVFRTKWWLPLQVLTLLMAVFGSIRHQYCRMAADPASALLLQPACTGVSDLHTFIAASFLGPVLYLLTSGSSVSIANPAACASMPMAARVLGWYAQASYGLFMPVAGFCTLEWRMKARWIKQKLGRQLVYGPWGWPCSQHDSGLLYRVQNLTSWVLSIAAGMGLLWVALTWLVPQLPLMECQTCADSGTCLELQCEEGFCSSPGHWTAIVLYLQQLFVLIGHLAVTRLV